MRDKSQAVKVVWDYISNGQKYFNDFKAKVDEKAKTGADCYEYYNRIETDEKIWEKTGYVCLTEKLLCFFSITNGTSRYVLAGMRVSPNVRYVLIPAQRGKWSKRCYKIGEGKAKDLFNAYNGKSKQFDVADEQEMLEKIFQYYGVGETIDDEMLTKIYTLGHIYESQNRGKRSPSKEALEYTLGIKDIEPYLNILRECGLMENVRVPKEVIQESSIVDEVKKFQEQMNKICEMQITNIPRLQELEQKNKELTKHIEKLTNEFEATKQRAKKSLEDKLQAVLDEATCSASVEFAKYTERIIGKIRRLLPDDRARDIEKDFAMMNTKVMSKVNGVTEWI